MESTGERVGCDELLIEGCGDEVFESVFELGVGFARLLTSDEKVDGDADQ